MTHAPSSGVSDHGGRRLRVLAFDIRDWIAPVYFKAWNEGLCGKVTEQWFPGGRHSAKSSYCARNLVFNILAKGNEKCHAVVFRKHQTDLKDSVVSEISIAMDQMGVSRFFVLKSHPLRHVRKDTGQTIFYNGLDDPKKHKSKKPPFGYVKYLWFEETDEFTSYAEIESVEISYLRGGDSYLELFTYNPPRSSANWVNAEAARHKPGRAVYHTDYRDIAACGWVSDAVLARIEHAKAANYENYRHVYLGEITGTGGEIFTNVHDAAFTDAQVAEWRANADWGMDFGIVNDPTVLEGVRYDADRNWLYVFEEWTKMHPYFTDVYRELEKRKLTETEIIADTAPAGWIQNINHCGSGARLRGCHKAEDWVETGVSWLRSLDRIVIDSERCPLAWDEFSHYEYDLYKDGKPKEKLPDRNNHGIDSVRYACEMHVKAATRRRFVGTPVAIKRGGRGFG